MKTALAVLLLLAAPLAAQEATPEPTLPLPPLLDMAPAPDAPAAITEATVVENADGSPLAVVPAPAEVTVAEAKAVADQSAVSLEAVGSGEITLAEATRDPTSGAPDPGEGGLFWLLAIVFGSVVKPATDALVDRIKGLDNRLSSAIHTGVLLATYLGAWALFHGSNPSLPQDAVSWAIAGFAAAGVGSAMTSVGRSRAGNGAQAVGT
jgi:hypothetical protein